MASVYDALHERRSSSKVSDEAPSHDEILELVEAAGQVADHSGLTPWRVIEIRGESRRLVGESLAAASGLHGHDAEKSIRKSFRAPLLLAVVVSPRPSVKVPYWEQEAVASGVAHALTLLLHERGYGAMWRTGIQTRSEPVRIAHRLGSDEQMLGWIYTGRRVDRPRERRRSRIDVARHVSTL
ncbi:nitroreductase [Agreia sp. Leaf335]|uniref:nitroreductase family protein n=1 Tax=Agreia sp. Leaf335 TaxID=1736340 RepID=UPI0006F78C4E|nr:nitroreductase family protein [Agreia sp. Leaf335]KQR20619.1 nitroreductase [Agreia sp. Leaf335]